MVDLHPAGFTASIANDIAGGQQVGFAFNLLPELHALLWSGTAASVVDLHPAGFIESVAWGIAGGQQVGHGSDGTEGHALLWSGTAASVVDLNDFLPAGYHDAIALGIDASGNIVGSAVGPDSFTHAILWIPVSIPEPSTVLLFAASGLAAILALARRGRNRRFGSAQLRGDPAGARRLAKALAALTRAPIYPHFDFRADRPGNGMLQAWIADLPVHSAQGDVSVS